MHNSVRSHAGVGKYGPFNPEVITWAPTYTPSAEKEDRIFLKVQSARDDSGSKELQEADGSEPTIYLQVMASNKWQMVKWQMKEKCKALKSVPEQHIRLLYKGVELKNDDFIDDYFQAEDGASIDRPISIDYLVIAVRDTGRRGNDAGLYIDKQVPAGRNLKEKVQEVWQAWLQNIHPALTDDGTGATYFLFNADKHRKKRLAVFKPKDEEAFAPLNPRGYTGLENSVGLREGVFSTQQAAREVAAFLIDHNRFAGVPETTLVHAKHPKFVKADNQVVWKIGAFQVFAECTDTAGNFAPQVFTTSDIHRVGVLDVRIVNLDRNDGNLLVTLRKGSGSQKPYHELTPIDHGLSLPDRLEVFTDDSCWMSWPQAKEPFDRREIEAVVWKESQPGASSLYIKSEGFKVGDRIDIMLPDGKFMAGDNKQVITAIISKDEVQLKSVFRITIPKGTIVRLQSIYAYIQSLDGEKDAKDLSEKLGIRRECLRLMEVTTLLLQIGARYGLTLFEIGNMLYAERPDDDGPTPPCVLKKLINDSLDTAMAVAECVVSGPTLTGLNLEIPKNEKKNKFHRVGLSGPSSPMMMAAPSPSLGPSSPRSHYSGSVQSVHGSPELTAAEHPDTFVLGPAALGDSDQELNDQDNIFQRSASPMSAMMSPRATEGGEDYTASRQLMHRSHILEEHAASRPRKKERKSVRQPRQKGMSSAPHREGKGKDHTKGIFERKDVPANHWSEELEVTFRRQIADAIENYIKKHVKGGAKEDSPVVAAKLAPMQAPDLSLASALPEVLPDSLQAPDRSLGRDVSPYEKDDVDFNLTIQECPFPKAAGATASSKEDAAPSDWGKKPTKGKYVPPHLR
mmetsp:Transcript_27335/g.63733  ORF Transcript_27335/g.63733 Transcript_27335/m.63733 type:complete len:852 (+) Transcript_27335:101-2656(+)|eukprot:CAMPEP_0178423684 /NCGR_PEP_ID=MMETSP0689_2-20121128/27814_1 /TAXON_ID=160604 /ORGANISM="Amphidinium massartii, Strain CS-259" /LENGTH=851 /DNA_ID=CAMNT_0020045283 /DNA_START=17 /DNA_END=2572 /DNA_ORIENTATION=-